jgi:8-oxo-dGTP diphosphatase
MRETLIDLLAAMRGHDALETEHIAATVEWVTSDAPLYRLDKADEPPQHLVSYFTLYDPDSCKLLLVDHKKSGLWLPSGGHVEPDEHPQATVQREAREELGIEASFLLDAPFFLTVTPTVGAIAPHVDVSLWYLLRGESDQPLWFDPGEFHQAAWFTLDALPLERTDPHLPRFVAKLKAWAAS